MDSIHGLLTSPWLAVAGTAASIIGLILTIISMLSYIQRRSVKLELRKGEDSYLKGLIEYIHHLNIHNSFDEQFFIEREYRVKDKYQPRSFFIARHQSIVPRFSTLFGAVTEQTKKQSDGYFSSNLYREATSRNEPIIVLGDPGSGKSVSARQLTIDIANRSLKSRGPNRSIPIFISLSEYTGTDTAGQPLDFYAFLLDTLKSRGKSTAYPSTYLIEHLDYYLDSGRMFFVLDSLDEMPPASFSSRCQSIVNFMITHSTNSFVVTCRSKDFGGNIKGREAYLDKLRPKEVKAFIHKRRSLLLSWKASEIYGRIMAPTFVLNSVVDNPFYLNLILFFISIKGNLPENFSLLFRVVCEDWAEREIEKEMGKGGINNLVNRLTKNQRELLSGELGVALSHIAFAVSNSSGFGTFIHQIELEALCTRYNMVGDRIRHAIRLGINGGMLDANLEESKLRFVHHKFQEYFAAEFLNKALDQKWIEYRDLPSICHNIWWEEVTAILTSTTDHPEEVIEVLLQDALTPSSSDEHATVLQRNFSLIGRCVRLLPNESNSRQMILEVVAGKIAGKIAGKTTENTTDLPLPVIIDCLRALGEIDDQRSVDMLCGYLKNSSKILREIAFSGLANSSLGRQFLAQHVYQVAYSIYFKGEYGGYGGHNAKNVRNIAFPLAHTRVILDFYSALGLGARLYKIVFTLFIALFAFDILLSNVYCALFIGLTIGFDAMWVYIDRTTPRLIIVLRGLLSRSILLALLAVSVMGGLFTPPFLSAISFFGVWLAHLVIMFSIFRSQAVVYMIQSLSRSDYISPRRFLNPRNSLRAIRNMIKNALLNVLNPRSFEVSADFVELTGLRLGYVDPDMYIQKNVSSIKDLRNLLEKIADAKFEGLEIDLFEAIQNAERRLLQKEMTPIILDNTVLLKSAIEEKDLQSGGSIAEGEN